jgi:hypothetical protein
VGFLVDIFHYDCKHKKSTTACQQHCNPYLFPELLNDDREGWRFNSLICEQTNLWVGGYHAILREMGADRYDFVLDEMVMGRNEDIR